MKLISFEGIDGSGKTTVISFVQKELVAKGYKVKVLQEPGTTPMGLKIRALLKSDVPRSKMSEVMLYEASRADMVKTVVKPAMLDYDYVLLDRYVDSTIAYQGYGNQNNIDDIKILNALATKTLHQFNPAIRFLIDVDLKTAYERRSIRNHTENLKDQFDDDNDFAKRVYDGYHKLVSTGDLIAIKNYQLDKTVNAILKLI